MTIATVSRITTAARRAWILWRHPRTPWYAKAVVALAIVYLVSPLDLIPDWIPILGQLDDLVVVPGLIMVAWRLVPPEVRAAADRETGEIVR